MNKKRFKPRPKKQKKNKDIGLRVQVYNNDIKSAWRRFKRRLEKNEVLEEVRARQFYEKPSAKKRRIKKLQKLKFKTPKSGGK